MHERNSKIAELEGADKIFWNKIEKIKNMDMNRYSMTVRQVRLLDGIYNGNFINGSYDAFCYGFYQGIQLQKRKAKKIVK